MKRIFKAAGVFISCIAAFSCNLQAQNGFTVKVKVSNPNNYTMLIAYKGENGYQIDTAYTMQNGYRVYQGNYPGIGMVSFIVRNPGNMIRSGGGFIPGPGLQFVARNGATITISGDAEKINLATVSSDDKETKAYEVFRTKNKVWADELFEMDKERYARKTDDSDKPPADKDPQKRKSLLEQQGKWARDFVKKYPNTYAAIEVFASYALELSDAEQAVEFAKLPATYKNSELGKVIQEKINGTAATALGNPAIVFSQPGFDGKQVDLAALRGKVVLIDFWGSWCVPCRASFPHLKELYAKYKSKGFEIVGIAHESGEKDQQQKAWADAVTKDQISWLNILNDADKNNIVKKYGVVAFPTKILVDRNGVIQGRYMGDQDGEFDKKLHELLSDDGNQVPMSGSTQSFGATGSGSTQPSGTGAKTVDIPAGAKLKKTSTAQPVKKD
ncbi:TlpA disulfide reductase family protein [Chitinophaga sp. XS-30]|uniref:TlpA family protein disulfide reductase n=1 Tax=Chitinophaga sp. XS-30 TaxID=2604421 RepID=UPI0011DE03A9|nr:TlpA disulfide reductase family protein [Chitinophaga sp. XS-30]QEH41204.1 AhpC/TSA family protein [Chitinophaga sp. XS-30]